MGAGGGGATHQHTPCPLPPCAQVGRVRSEYAVLHAVDHPYLAKLYATLQTGEPITN